MLIDAFDRMIEMAFENYDLGMASDWMGMKDVSDLFKVLIVMFPDKEDRDSFEGINEREEETMNEVIVMSWIKFVE